MTDLTPAVIDRIADLAEAALDETTIVVGDGNPDLVSFITPAGSKRSLVSLESYRQAPNAKRGDYTFTQPAGFRDYVERHRTAGTVLWADRDALRVIAVLDGHLPNEQDVYPSTDGEPGTVAWPAPAWSAGARWGRHRAFLQLRRAPEWDYWLGKDRRYLSQEDFAEHVEDALPDIVEPTAAGMLELAQTFRATTSVEFKSSKFLSGGEVELTFNQEQQASAGRSGQLTIPYSFALAVPVLDGGALYRVTARFRHRKQEHQLKLGYWLNRPDAIERHAFQAILDTFDGVAQLVHGSPASPERSPAGVASLHA